MGLKSHSYTSGGQLGYSSLVASLPSNKPLVGPRLYRGSPKPLADPIWKLVVSLIKRLQLRAEVTLTVAGKDLQRALWTGPPPKRMMPGVPRYRLPEDGLLCKLYRIQSCCGRVGK